MAKATELQKENGILVQNSGQIENITQNVVSKKSTDDSRKEMQKKFSPESENSQQNYQKEIIDLIFRLIPLSLLIPIISIALGKSAIYLSSKYQEHLTPIIDSVSDTYMDKIEHYMDRVEHYMDRVEQFVLIILEKISKIEINKIFSCEVNFADEDEMYQKVNKIIYDSKIEELEKYVINIKNTIKKLQDKVDAKENIENKSKLENFILILKNILIIIETQIICSN